MRPARPASAAAVVLAVLVSGAFVPRLHAQRLGAVAHRLAPPDTPAADSGSAEGAVAAAFGRPWQRPLASLLVPGSGQIMAGQSHGLVYLAVEAWAIARAIALNREGRAVARQYRDLAYDVARSPFAPARIDGPFEYYETMEKFVESGRYDVDPGSAFAPEADTATYNGSVWLLARRTFFSDPDVIPPPGNPAYVAAENFYRRTAVRDEFRWSWRDARLEQDVFRQQIRASDQAFRQRTNLLGLVVLNHVASAVDALITLRGARRPPAAPRLSFPGPDPARVGLRWHLAF